MRSAAQQAVAADRAPRVQIGGHTRFQVILQRRLFPAPARRLNREPLGGGKSMRKINKSFDYSKIEGCFH
jgi:hypothetical protein